MEPCIGRQPELALFEKALETDQAELIAVYGRRRVGKTFLIRAFFEPRTHFFEMTGLKDGGLKEQLAIFSRALHTAFPEDIPLLPLTSWAQAFELLTVVLKKQPQTQKIACFFDEVPWIATPKSGFLQQLDHFWNQEWSRLPNLTIILCGSAASWMIEKLIHAKGGLHNRLTRTMRLQPFTLAETKTYLHARHIRLNSKLILDLYMALGGVPYYLKQVEPGLSPAQMINRLCFQKDGILYGEFDRLFASLFQHASQHIKMIRAISGTRNGISREALLQKTGLSSGTGVNRYLVELEEAGFIAKFTPYGKTAKDVFYRVIDEYTFFYLKWIEKAPRGVFAESDPQYFEKKRGTPAFQSWAGYAFEGICLKHAYAIKAKLQIDKIPTEIGTWRFIPPAHAEETGAQIDLLFDRGDGIVSICEIKYAEKPFEIDKAYAKVLKHKLDTFARRSKAARKHLFLVMITTNGIKPNAYSDELVSNTVVLDDLFLPAKPELRSS